MKKSLFITGGMGNLGNTVTAALEQEPYHLHMAVRSMEGVQQQESKIYHEIDLSDEMLVAGIIEKITEDDSDFEAGIFMTGGYVYGDYHETSLHNITKMIHLNFETVFPAAKKLLQLFEKQGSGKLILIGAKAATDPQIAANQMAYSLSKLVLFHFSEMVNAGLNSKNITSHVLLPGALDTPLNREQMPDADFSKWSRPSDIAQTIIHILKGAETRTVIEL